MPIVIPPGFAQCAWRFTLVGDPEPMITTCGIDIGSFGGDNIAAAVAAGAAFTTNWAAASQGSNWTYIGAVLRVGQDGGPPLVVEAPAARVGTASLAPLPSNCCYLLRKLTQRGGRTGRGRMYLPPFGLDDQDADANGTIVAGTRSAVQTIVNNWFDDIDAVLLHDSAAPGGTVPTPVTQVIVDTRIATQRRRMRR